MASTQATRNRLKTLIEQKFPGHTVTFKEGSNHGDHFLLQHEGETKHLKAVKKAYLAAGGASEIALLEAIESEYVIKLEEHGSLDSDHDYLLFPHINGRTLHKLKDEDWSEAELKKLGLHVIQGIADMHAAGITHRDIKPKNIMRDDINNKYVIIDLGMGYFLQPDGRDNTYVRPGDGNKLYSSPEQFYISNNLPYEISSMTDQFSFGVILYELMTKHHPFIESGSTETQNYENAVTGSVTPDPITALTTSYSDDLVHCVSKMMSREPSQRYIDLTELKGKFVVLPVDNTPLTSSTFLMMPDKAKPEFFGFIGNHLDDLAGIVLTTNDTVEQAEQIVDLGKEVLFDPKTYQLQDAVVGPEISRNLGIARATKYDPYDLMVDNKDRLMIGAYKLSKKFHSSKVILPYFNIIGPDNAYLKFTKQLWRETRKFYEASGFETENLYGGIAIPYNVIVDKEQRAKLMSQLLGKYDIDGIFVLFENTSSKIATTVDDGYIEGLKELAEFFEKNFPDVIVHRTDISILPFLRNAHYTTGWAKGARHLKISGGGGRELVYKMKYYAPKLFTLIEEQTTIAGIISAVGNSDALKCDCRYCTATRPLALGYNPASHKWSERHHFLGSLLELRKGHRGMSAAEQNGYYTSYLDNADVLGVEIRGLSPYGTETIPSYEGLKSFINN